MKYAINCSIMYTELPLLERAAAAAADGYEAVEFWWPWPDTARPSAEQVDEFVESIRSAKVQLIGLNFYAGDMPAGERGVVCLADRKADYEASVATAVEIGKELGCKAFNALYGLSAGDPEAERQVAIDNLAFAGEAVAAIDGTVLLEPVSGAPEYALKTAADVMSVLDEVHARGVKNVGFLCDLYHLATNGDDVAAVVAEHGGKAAHVQIADVPGRGEPGTGELDLAGLLAGLKDAGYDGWVALEYKPTRPTSETYDKLPALP